MALITRVATAGIDGVSALKVPSIGGDLYAGEDLDPAAPCYIKESDGKVYMSNGTSANEAASVFGFTPKAYKNGEVCSLFMAGARFKYGSGLTPGDDFYLGATAGRLDNATTTGGSVVIARAVSATDIVVVALQ